MSKCKVDGRTFNIGRFSDPVSAEISYLYFKSSRLASVAGRIESENNSKLKRALLRYSAEFKEKADKIAIGMNSA